MVEDRVLGGEQSGPSVKSVAAPAAEMRWLTFITKAGKSSDRFAAFKVTLMIDSDAMLTFQMLCWRRGNSPWRFWMLEIFPHKTSCQGHVQSRFVRHDSYHHLLTINIVDPSTETISTRMKCGTMRVRHQRRHSNRQLPAHKANPSLQPNKVPNSVTNRERPTVSRQCF